MTLASVITADPPWRFGDDLPGKGRGASKHYATMPARDIEALNIAHTAVASDALLFLWRVASMQEEALRVCRAWGFRPVSEIVWAKTKDDGTARMGMGHYVRCAHETCIVAVRGRGLSLIRSHSVPSWFTSPRSRHSAKPDSFYDLIEKLTNGPYLEVFARAPRPGWTTVGLEVGSMLRLPMEGS